MRYNLWFSVSSGKPPQCRNDKPEGRVSCGLSGITQSQCEGKGCCYDEKIPVVPHCFFPFSESKSSTIVPRKLFTCIKLECVKFIKKELYHKNDERSLYLRISPI